MFGIAFALRRLPGVICALRRLGNRILASGLPAAALALAVQTVAFAPEALAQDACSDKGYAANPSGIGVICPVLTRDVSGFADHNTCVLGSSRPSGRILCLDAFGSDANIPQKPAKGSSPRYVYNCGSGMMPAGVNTVSATACCPAGALATHQTGHVCVTLAATAASLLEEVEKPPGAADLSVVVNLLARPGGDPNGKDAGNRPLLIVAARNGHAELVSVLLAAGADENAVDPTAGGRNVVHHAATPLSDPAAGPRALRASVLYYFGGGLDVRQAAFGDVSFDWNKQDTSGNRALDLLAMVEDENPRPTEEDVDILHQMANYIRAKGGQCGSTPDHTRRRICLDSCPLGQAVVDRLCQCPDGQGLENGVCAFCPPGEGTQSDGTCGACPVGASVVDGVCECPAGQSVLDEGLSPRTCYPQAIVDAYARCGASGHSASSSGEFFLCAVLNRNNDFDSASSGAAADEFSCAFPDSARESNPDVRLCSEVFGPDLLFPKKPPTGPERYVFNCDPDGSARARQLPSVPETINTIGAAACGCPDGERAVEGICFADAIADVADNCAAKGWTVSKVPGSNTLLCSPFFRIYGDFDGRTAYRGGCAFYASAPTATPSCAEVFGDPPQFPTASGANDERYFVANCSRGGGVSGAVPAAANTVAATACACDSGYSGSWPHCCPAGETARNDGTCGACPVGQGIRDGNCNACSTGQGILANNHCGACPTGQGILADRNCGVCPAGQGILPGGFSSDSNACSVCPPGQGIYANGRCGPCSASEGIRVDGTCGLCPAGERVVDFGASRLCYPQIVADRADKCRESGHVPFYGRPSEVSLHACAVSIRNAESEDGDSEARCFLSDDADSPLCSEVFGSGLDFPQKPAARTTLTYVYNCDPDGDAGLLPATVNTIGATECACPTAQGVRQGVLSLGFCGVCPPGQGVRADNTCGACPTGQGALADGSCGVCPAGEGVRADKTCGACPTGQAPQSGVCDKCRPTGQGVLADGSCGVCADGTSLIGGVCSCPSGQRFLLLDGSTACHPGAVVDNADACMAAGWGLGQHMSGGINVPLCLPKTRLYDDANGSRLGAFGCNLLTVDVYSNRCTDVFGDPPQFPEAEGDNDQREFVANCSRGGAVSNAIPAGINLVEATECACANGAGYPNCCPAGEGKLANGTCGVCPSGQGMIRSSGDCGVCPTGEERINGVCECSAGLARVNHGGGNSGCYEKQIADRGKICDESGYSPRYNSRPDLYRAVCIVPTRNAASGSDVDAVSCFLHDDTPATHYPLCSAVFGSGSDFAVPQKPTDGRDPSYVFNCDPNGTNGLLPATINTIGATECSCPVGQSLKNGVCAAVACPTTGQRVVFVDGENHCVANAKADIADACEAAGWGLSKQGDVLGLVCLAPSKRYIENSNTPGKFFLDFRGVDANDPRISLGCGIDSLPPSCVDMFGDPPQFPESTGINDQRTFLANCAQDGTIPGGIPADVNLVEATECACADGGEWPNCGCPLSGQGGLADGTCGACPPGQGILAGGSCGACPSGQGVMADGSCGACPTGQGVLDTKICGVCPSGQAPQGGVCTACTQGREPIDGVCACPAGQKFFAALGECYPEAAVDIAAKCSAQRYNGITYGTRFSPNISCRVLNRHATFDDSDSSGSDANLGACHYPDSVKRDNPDIRLCSEVFGPDFAFPEFSFETRYVFNCDPDGTNRMIPATVNTIGATACACPSGASVDNGVCVCPVGQGVLANGSCGACPRGQAVQDGACAACPEGQGASNGACVAACPAGQAVRGGVCAACPRGQAVQDGACAACPEGQGVSNGVCVDACPDGQVIRANGTCGACPANSNQVILDGVCTCPPGQGGIDVLGKGQFLTCYPQQIVDRFNICRDRGYKTSVGNAFTCEIFSRDVSGSLDLEHCVLDDDLSVQNACSTIFGPDFAVPQKPSGSNPRYVFNCDPNGTNRMIPATINTIGATECSCPAGQTARNGVCFCPSGQGVLADGSCGVCPAGQSVQSGVCFCPSGQGVLADGSCGVCTGGQTVQSGVCFCPSGQGLLADGTCGVCAGGATPIDGICACPPGERIVTDSSGSGCFAADEVDIRDSCAAQGWGVESGAAARGRLACDIPADAGQSCAIHGGDATPCAEVFGAPPQFPPRAGDDGRAFVYNCSSDGAVAAIPAGFNRNSEKECVCTTGGTYPNCDSCDRGRVVIDGVCGACPVGQDVYEGVCIPRVVVDGAGKCRAAGWSARPRAPVFAEFP